MERHGAREHGGNHREEGDGELAQAERCPKALGTFIKASEVQFHHEVTNQFLWSQF